MYVCIYIILRFFWQIKLKLKLKLKLKERVIFLNTFLCGVISFTKLPMGSEGGGEGGGKTFQLLVQNVVDGLVVV